MKYITILLFIFFANFVNSHETSLQDGFFQIDLFEEGDNKVANYRIPSLVTTKNGTLLAVSDARVDRAGDLPNNIDLALRRSTDNGLSWSKTHIIVDYPGTEGGGDPAMVVDQNTGSIWLFYVYGAQGIGINESQQGNDPDKTQQLFVMNSQDDGLSWSKAVNITAQIKQPDWYGVFFASGRGIQTKSGRLMVPLMVRKAFASSDEDHAHVVYSDDQGKSWHVGGSAGRKMGESKVVELADNSLMINMRSKHGMQARAVSISQDEGLTWSEFEHDSQLIEPACNASIIRYTSQDGHHTKNRILFANPASTSAREKLSVRISYDEGKTWSAGKVINTGPSAYSSLTVLQDGTIGLLYERGDKNPYQKISFARFSLEWLTDGKDSLEL